LRQEEKRRIKESKEIREKSLARFVMVITKRSDLIRRTERIRKLVIVVIPNH